MVCHFHLPEIFFRFCLSSHNLTTVDHRSAANRQNKVYLFFLCQLCTFLHFCIGRIGHNPRKIRHLLAGIPKNLFYFIVNTVFLNRAASISQHHILSIGRNCSCQMLFCCSFAKIDFRRIFIYKVLHNTFLLSFCLHYKTTFSGNEETISSRVYTLRFRQKTSLPTAYFLPSKRTF